MEFINLKEQQKLIKAELDKRISKVLSHGQYIMGPEVIELEERLSEFSGSKYCITVSSGTEALLISLMALDIQPGDEVITTPFTFVSTAEVIVLLGAIPVFADIDPETCNIDPLKIGSLITSRTKAIMPVSLYGQPADMSEINKIAEENNLYVIEDAAQSFGSLYKDKMSCNLSEIGCTSFFPSKPLGCYGDGGAIFTNNEEISELAKAIRIHGQRERYIFSSIGVGGRMDTIQSAVVLSKLKIFKQEIERRHFIGSRYNELFDQIGIKRVMQRPDRTSVFAQYTIFIEDRDKAISDLKEKNIPSSVHYPLSLNEQPAYKKYFTNVTPQSQLVSRKVLSLPMGPYLTQSEQDRVVEAIKSII